MRRVLSRLEGGVGVFLMVVGFEAFLPATLTQDCWQGAVGGGGSGGGRLRMPGGQLEALGVVGGVLEVEVRGWDG